MVLSCATRLTQALSEDEWGGSEIGSDTHEMEVQLDEYNST